MLEHVLKAIKDKFSISSDREARRMFDNTIDEIRDNPMDAELIVEENLKMEEKKMFGFIIRQKMKIILQRNLLICYQKQL